MGDTAKTEFLSGTGCAQWAVTPLAGDASARTYDRLTGPLGQTAILMDAGPDAQSTVPPFLAISAHLAEAGLCSPKILAASKTPQFLLIEDLGLVHFAKHLELFPNDEIALYERAVEVLLRLRSVVPPKGLAVLTPTVGAEMLDPFFSWFAPGAAGTVRRRIEAEISRMLTVHCGEPTALSLRDFHAENLIWRPDGHGTDAVGLLDYQDAFIAPLAYDLASLTRDARRDVSKETRQAAVASFAQGSGQLLASVETACAVLGLQRNIRILGIFTRLAERDGKTQYKALIPRVIAHIRDDLAHGSAAHLRADLTPILDGFFA